MGDKTKIEWADATWNPVTGCSKVSPGCQHCYAETLSLRYGWTKKPWTAANAAENVVCHPERLDIPLKWKRPRRIFVNSMSDLFHEQVPDGFVTRVWWTMHHAPHHIFQILTKRPERMRDWVRRWSDPLTGETPGFKNARGPEAVRAAHPSPRGQLWADMLESMGEPSAGAAYPTYDWLGGPIRWPRVLPNVWLGVSVEDQRRAEERIPLLLQTPAAVRFLSCEPLLGPIDLDPWLCHIDENGEPIAQRDDLHWVIVGGESGPHHRPMDPNWVRLLRDQVYESSAAFLFKQWGGKTPKAGGRELDGRTWDEYPSRWL